MKNITFKAVMVTALGSLVLSGCVVREEYGYHRRGVVVRETVVAPVPPPPPPGVVIAPAAEVIVTEAPPPVRVEVVPAPPGAEFIWIGGAWVWHGRWEWEAGHYARRPHRGAVWVPHHYAYRNGAHVWIEGGWR